MKTALLRPGIELDVAQHADDPVVEAVQPDRAHLARQVSVLLRELLADDGGVDLRAEVGLAEPPALDHRHLQHTREVRVGREHWYRERLEVVGRALVGDRHHSVDLGDC